jgi:hypothetical protein
MWRSGIEVGELAAVGLAREREGRDGVEQALVVGGGAREKGRPVTCDEGGQHLAVVGVQPLPVAVAEVRHRAVGLGEFHADSTMPTKRRIRAGASSAKWKARLSRW